MATEAPSQPDTQPPAPAQAGDAAGDATTQKPAKRSWRRKYRKMRIRFDDAMSESNALILQEWKAMGTARRLQENNDQLLELLLDFNEQPRVNPRMRYDLRQLSAADTAVPSSEAAPDRESVKAQLQMLSEDVAAGRISAQDYTLKADHLHRSQALQQTLTSLASLEATVPHTTRADLPEHPIDGIDLTAHAPGYMSPTHEEEYLLATDTVLNEPGFDPSLQNGRPMRLSSAHPPLGEKDLTIRNPDSVYNWLRKHQPQVFLQDKDAVAHAENLSDKSAPKAGATATGNSAAAAAASSTSKKSKRESAAAAHALGTPGPRDPADDDDSTAHETAKTRRKPAGANADDDSTYRPKGGSSRPSKRKREDGDTPSGKGKKKSRASVAASTAVGGSAAG
ncbi:hypothetical protein IAQ61_010879 [Plenodomus lingam]|uniref:uncharacterized protein n=1 Tax=Leptosphaeria maculans TaxID=5022 RepID=UPI003318DC1C|nr:hypothetical protein IAQ61_010879 [Plenodomus lingam]